MYEGGYQEGVNLGTGSGLWIWSGSWCRGVDTSMAYRLM